MSETRTDQRQHVLDVASHLFAARGFDDVTMAEIAEASDVARATVFNYFGSKHALIEAITETVLVVYHDLLDAALADDATSTPDLVRWVYEEMGKGIEAQRKFYRSIFREIARIQLGLDEGSVAQQANVEAIARLEQLIERGQQQRELTDALDARTLATAFRSLANGTINHWLYEDTGDSLVAQMRDAAEVFLSPVEVPTRRRKRGAR